MKVTLYKTPPYMDRKINDEKSTPEARAERLKRVRNLANLSRIEMCEGTDININTLKGWEVSRFGGLSKSGAAKVVTRLASAGVVCSVDWLLYEIGTPPQVNLSHMESAVEIEETALTEDKQKNQMTEELLLFRSHNPKSLDYIVPDESMLPSFNKGDMVAGIKIKNLEDAIGQHAIVMLEDGRKLLRNLCKGNTPGRFTLLATHLESGAEDLVLSNMPIKMAAPVIWHRKLFLEKP